MVLAQVRNFAGGLYRRTGAGVEVEKIPRSDSDDTFHHGTNQKCQTTKQRAEIKSNPIGVSVYRPAFRQQRSEDRLKEQKSAQRKALVRSAVATDHYQHRGRTPTDRKSAQRQSNEMIKHDVSKLHATKQHSAPIERTVYCHNHSDGTTTTCRSSISTVDKRSVADVNDLIEVSNDQVPEITRTHNNSPQNKRVSPSPERSPLRRRKSSRSPPSRTPRSSPPRSLRSSPPRSSPRSVTNINISFSFGSISASTTPRSSPRNFDSSPARHRSYRNTYNSKGGRKSLGRESGRRTYNASPSPRMLRDQGSQTLLQVPEEPTPAHGDHPVKETITRMNSNPSPKIMIHPPDGGVAFCARSSSCKCGLQHNRVCARCSSLFPSTGTAALCQTCTESGCANCGKPRQDKHQKCCFSCLIAIHNGKLFFNEQSNTYTVTKQPRPKVEPMPQESRPRDDDDDDDISFGV